MELLLFLFSQTPTIQADLTIPAACIGAAGVIIAAIIKFGPSSFSKWNGRRDSKHSSPLPECLLWRQELNNIIGARFGEFRSLCDDHNEKVEIRLRESEKGLALLNQQLEVLNTWLGSIAAELKKPRRG